MLPLALALLGAIAPASALRRQLNITLSNNSPLLSYQPPVLTPDDGTGRTGTREDSWNVTWSESSWADYTPNRVGHGTSEHATSLANASVTFSWLGTGIDFLGRVEGHPASVKLRLLGLPPGEMEDRTRYLEDGRVASLHDLDFGWHTVQLYLRSGTAFITGVEFTTEIETLQDSAEDTLTIDVPARLDDGINPLIPNLQGSNTPGGKQWNVHDVICTSDDPVYFPRMDTWDRGAWATMSAPANASYFTFWGSMNHDHRGYSLEIFPTPPGVPAGVQIFSGFTSWCTPDTLMYAAPLDPAERYKIRVINLVNEFVTDIKKATFWIANATSAEDAAASASESASASSIPSASPSARASDGTQAQQALSAPAIAGIVVGSVAGVALLVLAGFCLHRRREGRKPGEDVSLFEIDESKHLVLGHRRSASLSPTTPRSGGRHVTPFPYHAHSPSQDSVLSTSPLAAIGEHAVYAGEPPSYDPEWANSSTSGSTSSPSTGPGAGGRASAASFALSYGSRQSGEQARAKGHVSRQSGDSGRRSHMSRQSGDSGRKGHTGRQSAESGRVTGHMSTPSAELGRVHEARRVQGKEARHVPAHAPVTEARHTRARASEHRPVPAQAPKPAAVDRGPHDNSRGDPRRDRRTSSQVTELLSELWGAPLQRNGSTWKPVRENEFLFPKTAADFDERGDV